MEQYNLFFDPIFKLDSKFLLYLRRLFLMHCCELQTAQNASRGCCI